MKIHVLVGDSRWEINHRIGELLSGWGVSLRDVSTYGNDASRERVESDLRILPLFSPSKVVLWEGCKVQDLVELRGSSQSNLVAVSTSADPPQSEAWDWLKKNAQVEEFYLPKPWQHQKVQKKIQEIAQKQQIFIEEGAAEALAEEYEIDFNRIAKEMEKLSIYPKIDDSLVRLASTGSKTSVFDLIEALIDGRTGEAYKTVNHLVQQGQSPLQILGFLLAELDRYLRVKLDLDISSMSPARRRFLKKRLSAVSLDFLKTALELTIDTQNLLSEGSDPLLCLQTLVLELSLER
jgi:DNA polymerase III delta subunit